MYDIGVTRFIIWGVKGVSLCKILHGMQINDAIVVGIMVGL